MEERSVHLLDYVGVLKRRRWWLIVPMALGVLGGLVAVQVLPRQYQASTTLVTTTPTMTSDVVKPSVGAPEERIRAISQELLSRAVLERVAQEEGLAPGAATDSAVATWRDQTTVTLPKPLASTSRSGPDTFVVTYTGSTPQESQRIANRLSKAFVDQHAKMRETRAEHTSDFLATQLTQSRDRLRTIEERLRQVKETYMGRLPEQTQGNLQMVSGLRQQQENSSMSLRSDQDRLAMIERQLEAMKSGGADNPAGVGTISQPQQRIAALRKELDDASAMYTEKHPEVQRLKNELAAAQAAAAAAQSAPASARESGLAADPAYRQLLAEREAVRLRIKDRERAIQRAEGEIARYQQRVDTAPMIEQQLQSLTREYDLEKQLYNSLSERQQQAVLQEDLERRKASEQFAILYPAALPTQPSSPNVLRVLLLACALGVGAGVGLTFAREYLDRTVYDVRSLQQEFELPVLAEIPRIAAR
jgi:polysaccharide chain length determinant protein (PEP-CTERM system associated)